LLFTIYTSPISNVIAQFKNVNHAHIAQYADDTQLYKIALNTDDAVRVINDCFQSVHYWLDAIGLCLNPDKTESVVMGTGTKLRTEEKIRAVKVADTTVPVTTTVKSLDETARCPSINVSTASARQPTTTSVPYVTSVAACRWMMLKPWRPLWCFRDLTTVTLFCLEHHSLILTNCNGFKMLLLARS